MIFLQWEQIVGLKQPPKSQTRRPVKPNEVLDHQAICGDTVYITDRVSFERIKWQMGRTYAVQPGRGKKSVGRIRITKIRRERLGMPTEADARAEGCHAVTAPGTIGFDRSPIGMFADLWNDIYGSGAWDRMCGDYVWVLEFECPKLPPSA